MGTVVKEKWFGLYNDSLQRSSRVQAVRQLVKELVSAKWRSSPREFRCSQRPMTIEENW